jgi:predicted nucleic acid-binding Zn ribbon protein
MSGEWSGDDEEEAGYEESAYPDQTDLEDGHEPAEVPCPHCGKQISEEAQRCPHCNTYISEEDAPSHHSIWIIVGVIATIVAVIVLLKVIAWP